MNPASNQSHGYGCLTKEDLGKLTLSKVPIPINEAWRIFTLRQTELLDSDASDPSFDRFATLASRMFSVPIALVSLVDIDRQWFKANVGLEHVSQTHRDLAFCAYTVLPDSPDVFVIEDALRDYRFKDNPLVKGDPFIRFYAGAALIVDDIKVGSLCIIDRVPHIGFTETERMNLLDLGAAISNLIRERRDATLRSNKECAKMMNDMMRNVRTPLLMIAATTKNLLDDISNQGTSPRSRSSPTTPGSKTCEIGTVGVPFKSSHDVTIPDNSDMTKKVANLNSAVGQLKVIIESSICLGDFVVEKAESEEKEWASFTSSNILDIIQDCETTLEYLALFADISWDVDSSELCRGSRHVCSPKAITFVLLNTVEQLSPLYEIINVRIFFKDTGDTEYDCIVQQLDEAPICDLESTWLQGLLEIHFNLSKKRDVTDVSPSVSTIPQGYLSFYSLQQMLKDVEGQCTTLDSGSSYDQAMKVSMPCAIIVSERDKEMSSMGKLMRTLDPPHIAVKEAPPSRTAHMSFATDDSTPDTIAITGTPHRADEKTCLNRGPIKPSTKHPIHTSHTLDEVSKETASETGGQRSASATSVMIPRATTRPAPPVKNADLKQQKEGAESHFKGLSVLLVEDAIPQQKMMGKWLNGQGYRVTLASNGKIGLELLKTHQFDVCFMDFLMPVMTGSDAIKRLRDWCTEKCPIQVGDNSTTNYDMWVNKELMIIGLSASACDDELRRAFDNGMHFFCPKPVETTMLSSILKMRREASSLESALSIIGEQAVSVTSPRILTGGSLSQSKMKVGECVKSTAPTWDLDEDREECTGEVAEVVVCRGSTGWRLFKQISRLLTGDKVVSPADAHKSGD